MRWSASNTPTSTCHRAHESTQSAPASFSFWANGVKSGVLPGTTTTGIVSRPNSPACSLMKPSAKRLSHFDPNDVEQKMSGLAGGNASRGQTPPPNISGIFSLSDSGLDGVGGG